MSISNIYVNDTIRIRVRFVDQDPLTGDQIEVSPGSVSVTVNNSSDVEIDSGSATQITGSEYYYDFTPSDPGGYTITFVGTMPDTTFITVSQQLYVSSTSQDYRPSVTLSSDETILFAADIAPLYIDPEELLPIFPEASLIEAGELVHNYSKEVQEIYSLSADDNGQSLSFTALEYIKAAAACELSRTYGLGSEDELQVRLGDLSVTNRSLPRGTVNRGNATTWCQIAAALRKEMVAKRVSIKGVQPKGLPTDYIPTTGKSIDPETGLVVYLRDRDLLGPGRKNTNVDDPMPKRGLRSRD